MFLPLVFPSYLVQEPYLSRLRKGSHFSLGPNKCSKKELLVVKCASDPRTEALFNEITSSANIDWTSTQCRWGSVANRTMLGILCQLFILVSDESHPHCASHHSVQCEILDLLGSYIALAQIIKAKEDICLLPFPPETSKTVTAAPTVAFPGLKAYTNFPALTRSIKPGFPFVETKFLTILPEAGSISTRWFTATSVTKTVPVSVEKAAQQVAF